MNKLLNNPKKGDIDAIVVDLPYFQVVKDEFDNQWLNEKEYLKWVEDIFTVASMLIKDNMQDIFVIYLTIKCVG